MNKKLLIIPLLFIFILTGCSLFGTPIPEDKKDFIGTWKGDNLTITIFSEGKIKYEKTNGATTTIDAPIQEFTDEYIKFGVFSFGKTINIDKPPYQENNVWKMQIDGIVLTKTIKIQLKPIDKVERAIDEIEHGIDEVELPINEVEPPINEVERRIERQSDQILGILYEEVPELAELGNQIEEKSNGQAHLVMYIERELNYISEDEYERDYYRIYVGESHATHQVNIHRFLFHYDLNLKKILHVNPVTLEPETLEEWRGKK